MYRDNLEKFRKMKQISHKKLSEESGVSIDTITRVIHPDNPIKDSPRVNTLEELCKPLDIEIWELFYPFDQKPNELQAQICALQAEIEKLNVLCAELEEKNTELKEKANMMTTECELLKFKIEFKDQIIELKNQIIETHDHYIKKEKHK